MWMDANSLATNVFENDGSIAEDASWLQLIHKDWHINLVEINAILRGVNLVCNGRQV